jgi:hypothetical protein
MQEIEEMRNDYTILVEKAWRAGTSWKTYAYIQLYISINFMGRAVKMTSKMHKPNSSSNGNRVCNKTHLQNSHTSGIYTPEYNMKKNPETIMWEGLACLALLVPNVESRAYNIETSCSIMGGKFLDYIDY